jgi:hypothetical protein
MPEILTPADRDLIDRHFGTEDALDEADAVLVLRVLEYIRRTAGMNRRIELTLTAITSLSEHDPALARTLLQELFEASF